MSYNVSFISLGCAKNQVNCEQMMALCTEAGYSIQAQPEGCDVVVVNTCGFLASACEEAIGALDDGAYAAALVRHCGDMGYGPRRAREKLREKGVPQELWDEALDELPPDGEQIDRFLQSKLHGRSPEDKEKKRLTDALLRRGFSWGEVKSAWGRYGSEIWEE